MIFWDAIVCRLAVVPGTFWGVLAGSFFTLLGIWLTNKATDRRQERQLTSDRDLKNRERELALRKDIYLGVMEAITAGLNGIPKFSNLDLTVDAVMADFTTKSAAITKYHAVAKVPTHRAISNLTNYIATTILQLSEARAPLERIKSDVSFADDQIRRISKEADRWLEEIKIENLAPVRDEPRMKKIKDNFEFEQGRVDKLIKEQDRRNQELSKLVPVFFNAIIGALAGAQRLLPPVIVEIRRELEIATDEAAYSAILDETATLMESRLRDFIDRTVKRIG